jgi:hypothetical protein
VSALALVFAHPWLALLLVTGIGVLLLLMVLWIVRKLFGRRPAAA